MDNEKLNKEISENSSVVTPDYISKIPDKKNILSAILNKFKEQKEKKERKLLNPAGHKKTQVTNRSIISLWSGKNFLSNIFTSLDNVRKSISEKFSTPLPQNTLPTEIIGKNPLEPKENDFSKNDNITSPIFPKVKTTSKTIIDSAKTARNVKIEVSKIDDSAIKKEQELSDKNQTQDGATQSTKIDSSKKYSKENPTQDYGQEL